MNTPRFNTTSPAPLPRRRMFHFRVSCAGSRVFDVQAACSDDAENYVKRRNKSRIKSIEMIAEVKNHVR